MEPTILEGETIGATLLEDHENIQRGDIVVFRRPSKPPTLWVKRVIGVPGDVLRMKNYQLFLNDQLVDDTFYGQILDVTIFRDNRVITISEDSFFLMGDNRDESIDSRSVGWGPIARDDIVSLVGNKEGP